MFQMSYVASMCAHGTRKLYTLFIFAHANVVPGRLYAPRLARGKTASKHTIIVIVIITDVTRQTRTKTMLQPTVVL